MSSTVFKLRIPWISTPWGNGTSAGRFNHPEKCGKMNSGFSTSSMILNEPNQTRTNLMPNFTTNENWESFVKSPAIDIINNIVVSGKTNPSLRSGFDLNPEEFSAGALVAIEVVTGEIKSITNLDNNNEVMDDILRDQLKPECLKKVNAMRNEISKVQENLQILKEDVFLSWIAKIGKSDQGTKILFVTMSFPRLGYIRNTFQENAIRTKAFMEELHGNKDSQSSETTRDLVIQFRRTLEDPSMIFKQGDFLVSNFMFVQNSQGDWQIEAISMKPGRGLYTTPYYYRWKGRLGLTLRGMSMTNILRYDYGTDLAMFSIFIVLVIKSF